MTRMGAGPFVVIGNPHAGRGGAAETVATVVGSLRAAGVQARGALTTSAENATELADDAARERHVAVAVGGDGLLRAIVAGATRHHGTVGIIPVGRGNDYARTLGIPSKVGDGIRVLLEAHPRPADCIAVALGAKEDCLRNYDDIAIGNVYVGFDSISNVLANDMPVNLGPFTYKFAAVHAALTMPQLTFRLLIDGHPYEYAGSGVAIANSCFYGGGIPLAPRADVHDGMLDVLMFEQVNRRARIANMLAMRKGAHVNRGDVHHLRAKEIQVCVDPPIDAFSDGDLMCKSPLTAHVMRGAIQLLRP
jgi:diacylglycerol kinase (ATP)